MKFPTEHCIIITVKIDPKVARECYAQSLKVTPIPSKLLPLTTPLRWNKS